MASQKKVWPLLRTFLRGDGPVPFMREVLGGLVIVAIILIGLWGGTGQDFPSEAPVVVVESGSMMHCANGVGSPSSTCERETWGRIGTIDPGDLVFVRDVKGRDDVTTVAGGGKEWYGEPGDVIVYRKGGSEIATPIIHRAMFWLDIHDGNDGTNCPANSYSVVALGILCRSDLNHPVLQGPKYELRQDYHLFLERQGAGPENSGFVTRGDNNNAADQPGISDMPVRPEWIIGKARGEVPWVGLVKLKVSDISSGTDFYDRAPPDIRVMLWVFLGLVVGAPVAVEVAVKAVRATRRSSDEAPAKDDDEGDEFMVLYVDDDDEGPNS